MTEQETFCQRIKHNEGHPLEGRAPTFQKVDSLLKLLDEAEKTFGSVSSPAAEIREIEGH
jgi:hypothetical protein